MFPQHEGYLNRPCWPQIMTWLRLHPMQTAEGQELLDAKRAVAAVKKVSRLRTAVAWKEWRAREEESTGAQLQVGATAIHAAGTCNPCGCMRHTQPSPQQGGC